MINHIRASIQFVYNSSVSAINFLNKNITYRVSSIFSSAINKISSAFSKSSTALTENYSIRGNGFARSKEYQNLINQMKSRQSSNNFASNRASIQFIYNSSVSAINFLNKNITYRVSSIFSSAINKISSAFSKSSTALTENYSVRGNGFARSKEYQNLINQMKSRQSSNNFASKNLYAHLVCNKNI